MNTFQEEIQRYRKTHQVSLRIAQKVFQQIRNYPICTRMNIHMSKKRFKDIVRLIKQVYV